MFRLGVAIQDSTDNLNHPDLMTQGGKVSVKCDAPRIKYREDDGRIRNPGFAPAVDVMLPMSVNGPASLKESRIYAMRTGLFYVDVTYVDPNAGASGCELGLQFSYSTKDAWPTKLPGVVATY